MLVTVIVSNAGQLPLKHCSVQIKKKIHPSRQISAAEAMLV